MHKDIRSAGRQSRKTAAINALLLAQMRHALKAPFYLRRIGLPTLSAAAAAKVFPNLPTTTKIDLVNHGLDFLAVPAAAIREWVTTSGTTGSPVHIALAERDLNRLAENEAAAFALAGIRRGDGVLIGVGMDRLFVAGLAYWLGAQRLGATCLRMGPAMADFQTLHQRPLKPGGRWFLIAVPSLLAAWCSRGLKLPRNLAAVICIGEPLRDASLSPNILSQSLMHCVSAPLLSTYATTETCTTLAQGPQCDGGHVNPHLGMVEILDAADQPCASGTPGRVVITPFKQEAIPPLRYDTGDIAALYRGVCPCGRQTPRLGPVLGRAAQLLKVQGVSTFASALADLARSFAATGEFLVHATSDALGADHVTVWIDSPRNKQPALRREFEHRARAMIKWVPELKFAAPHKISALRQQCLARKHAYFVDGRTALVPQK